jgi:O-antigen ligase
MKQTLRELLTTFHGWAWLLGFMLIFWAPLPGEQRLPTVALIAMGLWLQFRRRDEVAALPGKRPMRQVLLLLAAPCIIALPFSEAPKDSLGILLVFFLFYWVGLAILAGLATRPVRIFTLALGVTLLLWGLDGLVQLVFGVDLIGVPRAASGRLFGIFGDNQRLGVTLGVMMPLAFLPLVERKPLLAMLAFAFLTFIVSLVGARAAMVFALLAGGVLLYVLPGWRYRLGLVVAGLAVIVSAIFISPIHTERILHRDYTAYLDNPALSKDEALFLQVDDILSGRLKIWSTGWNMFQAHPLVGVGAGAFDDAYDRYSTRPDDQFTTKGGYPGGVYHAHQLYVSAAAETGLIGLACLAGIIALLVRWYRSLPPTGRQLAAPYAYSLMIAFFPLNSQHGLFIGWWFITLFLLLCAMLAAGEQGRSNAAA